MQSKENVSVIILSAGFSSRMKQAKFSLIYDKQKIFLEKIIDEYLNFGCKEIVVVMNKEGIKLKEKLQLIFPKNVKFIQNNHPEYERFYSLQLGIKSSGNCENIFIQSIDNPFVTQNLLSLLIQNKNDADYIIPSYNNKGGHPILISKKIINSIKKEDNYNIILKDFLRNFTKFHVKTNDEKILLNINTMDIYNDLF